MARRILIALTARLSLVAITVDGENPYEIFESLNWKGLPLEEADLIRNFLFMQVPPAEQAQFHESRWIPYESRFEKVGRYEKIPPTQFYRNYLMRNGHYCRNKTAYVEFKRQNADRGLTTNDQVTELQRFATFELWLQRPAVCEREYLRERLSELQQLDVTTAHPLLLNLLDRHDRGLIQRDEIDECLRDLASFVIRRTICGESTRGYGRWFPEAILAIQQRPKTDLRDYWLDKGWPDDATFISRLVEFPLYQRERKKCRYLLEQLERACGHRELVSMDDLQIEHVLPQTIENNPAGHSWKSMLGVPWEQEHAQWIHTLGNLTLTGYNQTMGNGSFAAKKQIFAQSNVSLNLSFNNLAQWGVSEIKNRAVALGGMLTRIWPRPDGRPYVSRPADPEELFEEIVEAPGNGAAATGNGRLKVIIHWSMLGIAENDEPVQESSDAATHAKFIGRLIAKLGPQMRERLKQIPVARSSETNSETGYRVSGNPARDFLNRNTQRPFNHKLIPGTDLYLFTNTDKPTKAQDIRRLTQRLGFPPGSFEAS